MAEQKVLSKLNVLARASQREEVQPLDLVAMAVLAVKTASRISLCSKILNILAGFWGEGSLAFLEAQMSMNQKLKAIERCEAVAASVKD